MQFKNSYIPEEVYSISTAIESTCKGRNCGRGAVGEAQASIDNISELLGRLVTVLHNKDVLSDNEVLNLMSYDFFELKE